MPDVTLLGFKRGLALFSGTDEEVVMETGHVSFNELSR